MDIDSDVDGKLAQELRCLGTSDHDALVQHFIEIVGSDCNLEPETYRNLLDMNNWNLQAALGSFYDYRMRDQISIPSMTFIRDETVGEGESIPPNTSFVKVWRVANSGSKPWPPGCMLRLVHSEFYIENRIMEVKALQPGEEADISVTMVSPSAAGVYQSRWKMATNSGYPFGETIWCIILVEESGLLALSRYQGQEVQFVMLILRLLLLTEQILHYATTPKIFQFHPFRSIFLVVLLYTMIRSCLLCHRVRLVRHLQTLKLKFHMIRQLFQTALVIVIWKTAEGTLVMSAMSKVSVALSGMSTKMLNKFASPSSRLGKLVIPAINASKPRLQTFLRYAKVELMPPSIGEWPKIVSEVNNFRRTFNPMDLTVKEAIVYSAVAFEVLMWFFAGEILGRRHFLGYYIEPNFQPIFIERFQDWKEPELKEQ
ncbi:Protein ILRUN [Trichinella spiralis]|uniref:Protein ILRUN n=1 Tax=Trichinella spiralis TaxID=6334 RepID=A0ABR3KQ27_TRISP